MDSFNSIIEYLTKNKTHINFMIIGILFMYGFYYFLSMYKENKEPFLGMNGRKNCPNLLIKKGDKYFMYNTQKTQVPGVNPIQFNNLEEYVEFTQWLSSSGIKCPILYAEQTYDTQGERTYKFKSDPKQPMNGLPPVPTTKLFDAGHNKGSMPGFDPHNQYIGDKTPLDEMFHDEENNKLSDNPMDNNFGGKEYAEDQVNSGAYADNQVSIYVDNKI